MATSSLTTTTPRFNVAAIMADAWARFRKSFCSWETYKFDREKFRLHLWRAWRDAKTAALSPKEQMIQHLENEIELLRYKPQTRENIIRLGYLNSQLRTHRATTYRGYKIEVGDFDWHHFVHDDYDGADDRDNRKGFGVTLADAKARIDEIEGELEDARQAA